MNGEDIVVCVARQEEGWRNQCVMKNAQNDVHFGLTTSMSKA